LQGAIDRTLGNQAIEEWQEARTKVVTSRPVEWFHRNVCGIYLGVLTHVDGSNESPHDGEHRHPWPCEALSAAYRDATREPAPAVEAEP
jgi:hypothetical protein